MSNVIDSFRDEYFFLSNMFDVPVVYWGGYGSKTKKTFDNNESAFQAQKSTNPDDIDKFIGIPGKRAKYLGKRVPLRSDWNQVKE